MLVFLAVMVVFVVVGIAAWTMRNRTERGIESGISSFRRELDALAPRGDPKARPLPRRRSFDEEEADRDDEGDGDDQPEFRTVQIGEKPPPRKLKPPTAPGEMPGDAVDTPEPEPPPAADERDAATDEERADGT